MTAESALTRRIRDATARVLPAAADIADDQDLLAIGMDSIGVVSLVSEIEQEFGIDLPLETVSPENFQSLRSLTKLLNRLVGLEGPSGA